MSAREMFEKLGYKCFDDRERDGLPLIISYVMSNDYELGGLSPYVEFVLPDKRWRTNIVDIKQDVALMNAIHKQLSELNWK